MLENLLNTTDLWDNLKNSDKPIVLYGMGDGADKVIAACELKGIKISGVFASDGFSKNKIFHDFEVTDYSSAKEKFGNMIVLMSFASNRDDVIENVIRISKEQELYCPDVPVFGGGLFDKKFFTDNYEKFQRVYESLCDNLSKEVYCKLIHGKLTGSISSLIEAETSVEEAYTNIIKPNSSFHYVDIGAYNGDTIREFLSYSGGYSKITAFEPDAKNYKKLCLYANDNEIDTSAFFNIAAWHTHETLTFYSRSGRNSANTTSHKNVKQIVIEADAPDNYINEKVHFINIDAEGSDRNAILGLKNTISNSRPVISCAVYHRNEDFFDIPMLLKELYGGKCKLYFRHFKYFPAWDTNVYCESL